MALTTGTRCRVLVDGIDITRLVHTARIDYEVDTVVRTTLVLYDSPRIDEYGNIHLGAEPAPVVSRTLPHGLRAILFRDDE